MVEPLTTKEHKKRQLMVWLAVKNSNWDNLRALINTPGFDINMRITDTERPLLSLFCELVRN